MFLDFSLSAEFIGFVFFSGWQALGSLLFGFGVIFLLTSIREPDPVFFKLHFFFNCSAYCFMSSLTAVITLWRIESRAGNQKNWMFVTYSVEGLATNQTILFSTVLIVSLMVFLSAYFHPPIYKQGEGIRVRPETYFLPPRKFYTGFILTILLRNFAIYGLSLIHI